MVPIYADAILNLLPDNELSPIIRMCNRLIHIVFCPYLNRMMSELCLHILYFLNETKVYNRIFNGKFFSMRGECVSMKSQFRS